LLSRIVERGLVKDAHLLRLEVKLTDVPGALHELMGLFATTQANILQVAHDRAFAGAALGESVVDVTIETRGREHLDQILATLRDAGYEARRA
jgi:threonine dehydratase